MNRFGTPNLARFAFGALAVIALLSPTEVGADVIANFNETDQVSGGAGGKGFVFTNNGSGTGTVSVTSSATFSFTFAGALTNLGTYNTSLTMTGTTTDAAQHLGKHEFPDVQLRPDHLHLQRPGHRQYHLRGSLQTAGDSGSGITINKTATSANAGFDQSSGDLITFTSPLLVFQNITDEAITFSFNPLTPPSGSIPADGIINSFAATLGGTFSSVPLPQEAVPEPASFLLFTVGLIGFPILAWRRNRKSAMIAA